jgi:hypothetical protein
VAARVSFSFAPSTAVAWAGSMTQSVLNSDTTLFTTNMPQRNHVPASSCGAPASENKFPAPFSADKTPSRLNSALVASDSAACAAALSGAGTGPLRKPQSHNTSRKPHNSRSPPQLHTLNSLGFGSYDPQRQQGRASNVLEQAPLRTVLKA